jgi:diphthamide biosynthesis protein 4
MNAYEILQCLRDCSFEELKASYHRLLLVHHPDKHTGLENDSDQKIDAFLRLQSAYKLLSDQSERSKYDSLLKQTELEQKANQIASDDNSNLLLEQDFDHDLEKAVYTRRCRCGDSFSISQREINTLLTNILSSNSDSLVVGLECNTCSIVINVLII